MRLPRLIVVLLLVGSVAARADDLKDQARRDVSAGLAAQSAGRYDEAIALYKKAYAAIPHPEILFDLGQAYRLKGDAEAALDYYRRYLAAEPGGRAAGDANRWVAELGKQLADRKRELDRKAGDSARKPDPGAKDTTRKSDVAGKLDTGRTSDPVSSVDTSGKPDVVSSADTGPAAPAPAAAAGASSQAAASPAAPPQDARPAGDSTATWIFGVGGGASLIAGLGVGSLASSKRDQAAAICGSDHRCDSIGDTDRANALLAQSRTRGDISTALVVIGVVSLATTVVLWSYNRGRDGSGVAIAPVVSSHDVGIVLGGTL